MPEYSERSMRRTPRVGGIRRSAWRPAGGGCGGVRSAVGRATSVMRPSATVDPTDHGLGLGVRGAADLDRADRAGGRGRRRWRCRRPGVPTRAPALSELLQRQQLGVLRGDLLELLHLGEGRGLRHELAAAGRVARVLETQLGDQELEEGVLADLVLAVRSSRRRWSSVCRRRRSGWSIERSPGQTRTSTPDDADWSVVRAAGPSPRRSGEEPQARGRESCRPGWSEPPCWPARASSCCWELRRSAAAVPAGGVQLEPVEGQPGGLQVAPQVGQRLAQRVPAGLGRRRAGSGRASRRSPSPRRSPDRGRPG